MADIQSNIKFNIDTSDAMASIKALQGQISAFQAQMAKGSAANAAEARNLQRTLIDNINATKNFSASVTTIRTSTESFTNALEKNKLSLKEYFRYAGGASKSFGKLFGKEFETVNKVARERVKDLQTQYIQLGRDANGAMQAIKVRPLILDMDNLGTKTAIAAQRQQLLNQLLKQGSTNLLNFGKNTQWAGRQLMVGFSIPLGIVGQVAAKTFMEMEAQAVKFKRVYGDMFTTTQETNKALKDIRALASEFTKYGVAASKTMELAAQAAATGKTGADLLAQVNQANRLAVLGNVEQQQALETTMSLTNAFGTSADKLSQKVNFLNAVENQTVTSIEDLTVAIPKAGPVIKQLGGNVEDLAFFLTAMREGGINASEGANALKSGLAALINPTAKASAMLGAFGINITGIVEANKGDIKGLVTDFSKALDTLDPLNRARAIEQLFGKFQFSRLSTLFQNVVAEGTQASRVLEMAAASSSELAGLANSELKKLSESPMYKFQKAVEDIKVQLAPVGEEFLKAITPIIQFGTDILKSFNNLNGGMKQFIINMTGIVGGLGPIFLMTFGLIANGAANIIKLFSLMKSGFNNLGKTSNDLASQTQFLTTEQIQASSVAASLDQVHSKLRQTFTLEAGAVNQLTAAYQRNIAASGMRPGVPGGKRFANGGMISGPGTGTSDSIPALVSNGEYVVNAKATKKNLPILDAINSNTIAKFSLGGRADKRKRPTTFSVSGGSFEQKRYSKLAMFAPGNTPGGFGLDTDWLKNSPEAGMSWASSLLGGYKQSSKTTGSLDKVIDSVLPKFSGLFEELLSTYRQGVDNAKDVVDLGRQTYPKMKEQLSKAVSSGKITLREAAHINNSLRAMVNPRKSDYTEYTSAPRYEGAFDDKGVPFYKRAGATERAGKTLRSSVSNIYEKLRARAGLGARTRDQSWSHLTGSLSEGMVYQEPRIRTVRTKEDMAIATATKRSLQAGVPVTQGALSIDSQGIARSQAAGDRVGKQTIDAFNQGLEQAAKTASPSRRTRKTAENVIAGFDNGLKSGIDDAKVAGQSLSNAAVNGIVTGGVSGTARRAQLPEGAFIPPGTQSGGRQRKRSSLATRGKATYRGLKSGNINAGKGISRGGFGIGAIAGTAAMFAPPEMQGVLGTISMASSFIGMFGGALGKVVPLLLRFAGPIGIAITAITALGFVAKMAADAEKKKIDARTGVGKSQLLGAGQKSAAGGFFGKEITPTSSILDTKAISGSFGSKASAVSSLAKDADFKKGNAKLVSSLKNMSSGEVQQTLQNLGMQLRGQGYSNEEVQTQLQALQMLSGQGGTKVGSQFGLGTKVGQAALGTSIGKLGATANKIGNIQSTTTRFGSRGGTGMTSKTTLSPETEAGKKNLETAAGGSLGILQALKDQYHAGLISANQYRKGVAKLAAQFKTLTKQGKELLVSKMLSQMKDEGMKNVIKATKDLNEQFKLLVMYQNNLISFDDQVGLSGTASSRAITTAKLMSQYTKEDFGKTTDSGGAPQQTALEKRLEATQKKIDLMQIALDVISYQEDKINKKYDDRVAVLDKIRQANEEITRQQQMQLGLADAISRGDVAAAANAAQEMRAASASSSLDRQGSALEAQRQAELSGITAGGKNRSQLEAQIAKLQYQDNLAQLGTKRFANGGLVPSYFAKGGFAMGTDTVPAMLTPGEFVIKKSAVDRIGVGTLNKINGYAKGGQVQGGSYGNSMYNSYSINLNVNSNSDANDIANKVIETIRRVESQNIRSNRF